MAGMVEEMVVSSSASEHVGQIDDSVRRADVEIDRDEANSTMSGSRFGTDRR